jgi:hypothetical protein
MVPVASEDGAPGGVQGGGDGQSSRSLYYDQWAGHTAAAAKELQQEEQAEKAAAERCACLHETTWRLCAPLAEQRSATLR